MADSYYTILTPGRGEYEEKRSRFLGEALPVSSPEEIAANLERIRRQYYDARHHCYAWVLGERRDSKKASDDGEPSGTAGLPILKVIEGSTCTNILIVVTRYFGGTLLGTGGLVRAYTAAAKAALSDAGPVCMKPGERLALSMEYSLLDPVNHYLRTENIAVEKTDYTDQVKETVLVPEEKLKEVRQHLEALGNGRIGLTSLEKGFYGF